MDDLAKLEKALDAPKSSSSDALFSQADSSLSGWSPSLSSASSNAPAPPSMTLEAAKPSKEEVARQRKQASAAKKARKAAATAKKNASNSSGNKQGQPVSKKAKKKPSDPVKQPTHDSRKLKGQTVLPMSKQVSLFGHLPQVETVKARGSNERVELEKVHPSIVALGLKYSSHALEGSDERAIGLIDALCDVVESYVCPRNSVLCRDFLHHITPMIAHLESSRTKSLSMGNVVRHLRAVIAKVPSFTDEQSAKRALVQVLLDYKRVHIEAANASVVEQAVTRVSRGDVVLAFGEDPMAEDFLLKATKALNGAFRVVLVGQRPSAGKKLSRSIRLLKKLGDSKCDVTFVQLSGVSYMMRDVDKVFLGADGMYANGTALGKCGTAMIACVANEHQVPVIVLCATYKFSERVQLDAIVNNELKNPDDLILPDAQDGDLLTSDQLADWRDIPTLKILNLEFDVTPADLVKAVITEVGILPASSVPVMVRERSEALANFNLLFLEAASSKQ